MFTRSWRRSAFAFKGALAAVLALLALFCLVRPASAEGSESSVQIEIYLTDAWSGVEFALTTSEGLYDGTFTVGSDGALNATVPTSDSYMFTSNDILESTPAKPDEVATTETNAVTGSSVSGTEISIFLGEDWSGAVFNAATDLSVFPNGFAVDETGYLNIQVDESSTYVISAATVADVDNAEDAVEQETTDAAATETTEITEETSEVTESTGTEETHSAEQSEDTNTAEELEAAEESEDASENTAADAESENVGEREAVAAETTGVLGFLQNNPFVLVYFAGLIVIIIIFIVLKVRSRNNEYEYEYEDEDEEEEEDDE